MNLPLFQNKTTHSPTNRTSSPISIRCHDSPDDCWIDSAALFSCHCPINQIATAKPRKPSQTGQIFRNTFIVCSPAVAALPGPGNLGVQASMAWRQLDPANEASQF